MSRALFLVASAAVASGSPRRLQDSAPVVNNVTCITQDDVDATIDAFMQAVVSIGKLSGNCTSARGAALGALDAAYAYDVPGVTVLFKPTLTEAPHVYRPTKEGALSYFVGKCVCPAVEDPAGNGASTCGEAEGYLAPDSGFAFAPSHGSEGWAKVERSGSFLYNHGGSFCEAALAQGAICFTAALDGSVVCVDKTFGFVPNPNPDGALRALLSVHHSSLQLSPTPDPTAVPETSLASLLTPANLWMGVWALLSIPQI
jgi:hypothetical protein